MKIFLFAALLALVPIFSTEAESPPQSAIEPPALTDAEWQFLDLLNEYRAENGRAPLRVHPELTAAVDWHTDDMATNSYFGHADSTGRNAFDRMCDFGYCWNTWKGENIAGGFGTPETVLQAWKNSPGHNSNMISQYFVTSGLDFLHAPGSVYTYYWANNFGGLDPDVDADGWTDSQEFMTGKDHEDPCSIPPDINGNGIVNTLDAGQFVFHLNDHRTSANAHLDLNQDGTINTIDVGLLVPLLNDRVC